MAPFSPVQPVRLYERIVEQIEQAVRAGELRPGQRLPSERQLVAEFGASRATVREALRVLESNGVVRSRPGDPGGPEVLGFSTAALSRQLQRLAGSAELDLADLVGFRMIMDGAAVTLAAQRRTDDDLATLDALVTEMEAAAERGFGPFSEADLAFHEALTRAAGNTLVLLCLQSVRSAVLGLIADELARASDATARMRESVERHRGVLAAVRAGDGEGGAAIARRDLYDYYAPHVAASARDQLRALLG
ncbi:DNA-binding FadR family transcriptional regulator [Naumannella cuiyingiana]|uniref:DNA-binding FadR family transcriptional regulator n=1 Tax=Naumannella cuiyingiana TaxID=1347891 RepID=A0A7Z0DAR1_9ACTN|nr:FadR/GntR family transcriptional regulator [Naumannella cuiyingiana]NYI71848.1 DNA-binding FadR family transcriptional regulator [Naumannella cuiyingiana]